MDFTLVFIDIILLSNTTAIEKKNQNKMEIYFPFTFFFIFSEHKQFSVGMTNDTGFIRTST